jgi:anti-anti-sigma factor
MAERAWKPPTGSLVPSVSRHDPLVVQATHLASGMVLVNVSGGIDTGTAFELHRQLLEAIRSCLAQPPRVLLDLSGVTSLDHAGLDALLALQDRVRAASGSVELMAPSPSVVRLLHEAELDGQSHVTIGRDEHNAG